MGLSDSKAARRALGQIDPHELTELVRTLVAIPSVGGNESAAQRTVARWMRDANLQTDEWAIDLNELARHPDFSSEVVREEALGVMGWTGERSDGRDLMLNGHIDVVPPGDGAWSVPPWSAALIDGAIYGRGAVDMKGGLGCALVAAAAIQRAGVKLRGRLSVASVVGEEDGGGGTLATLLRGHHADGAVIVEPTDLHVVTAQAGALTFRITIDGRAAHGGARTEGVSAVEKFLPVFAALRELEQARNSGRRDPAFARYELAWPLEVGVVRAGDWPSSVPARLTAEGRYGVAMDEDPRDAQRAFEAAVAEVAARDTWLAAHPPLVQWWGGRFDPARTDPDDALVQAVVEACFEATGTKPVLEGVTYGADLRLLVNQGGMPSVLFGPGDVRLAHMPDEFVSVEALVQATRALVLAALAYCGCEPD